MGGMENGAIVVFGPKHAEGAKYVASQGLSPVVDFATAADMKFPPVVMKRCMLIHAFGTGGAPANDAGLTMYANRLMMEAFPGELPAGMKPPRITSVPPDMVVMMFSFDGQVASSLCMEAARGIEAAHKILTEQ